jgi:putative MATE family efflux protein
MSNGGLGGGVSSAIARASGAGRWDDAEAVAWHAVVVAMAFGIVFAVILLIAGPALYRAMGATGAVQSAALSYSNIIFAGSPLIWLVALLSAALRGTGDARTPSRITLGGAAILLPLSPLLIFGFGPLPALGVAGAGLAVVLYYVFAAAWLIGYMRSNRSGLKLAPKPLETRLFKDILGVGLLSALSALQLNLTVSIVTTAISGFGAAAIAGYGIASRLDYVLIPILFGLGTAILTMVGTNIGAGQSERAQRIAWIGAAIAFGITELVGMAAATFPYPWLRLFSNDPQVLSVGATYLQNVAPAYGGVGIGLTLYFASQGAKRVLWPVLAGTARMIVAAFLGWVAVTYFDADLPTLFRIIASASIAYGVITLLSTFASGRSSRSIARPIPQISAAE